ncbi:BUD32 family EKC/KEOPS complex subunit [Poriferisphaera corsica]|nr:hypothetical protein [Poriferisphaera corsica]
MCNDTHPNLTALVKQSVKEVYKQDRRSRVWLVEYHGKPYVIKRFEYIPLRQILGWIIGLHPAQIEARRATQLIKQGLPAQPIVAAKLINGKAHLLTEFAGQQAYQELKSGNFASFAKRKQILQAISRLMRKLITSGWVFRDCKLSNMIISDKDRSIKLIDVGSFKRNCSRRRRLNMIRILDDTAKRANLSRAERLRMAISMGLNDKEIRELATNPQRTSTGY